MTIEHLLRDGLERLRLPLDDAGVASLAAFVELLERWNRSYNLTAVRDPAEMVPKHILDSLSVLPWSGEGRLLDVGAGAGLPGIPLAVARTALDVTLVDSAGKKVRFMNHVKRELALANIHPLHARVEDLSPSKPFDTVISRAFSSLASFARSVRPLAQAGARLLAMKGRYPGEEIAALPEWAAVCSVEKLEVPGLHEQRHLVIMSVNP
jgi:16S rRNA (guanine527-N7)-methyltransferase